MSVRLKLTLVVLLTAVMAALILAQVKGVNGPWYWWWPWRRVSFWPLYPAMFLASSPFVAAQFLWSKGRRRPALACLFAATLFLMLTALACQPPTGLRRLPLIVQSSVNTSYYLDAAILHDQKNITLNEWLYQFPDILPLLHIHARYKPPGLLLYYLALIVVFGKGNLSATLGGVGVALLASASVPATYAMLRRFGQDRESSFCQRQLPGAVSVAALVSPAIRSGLCPAHQSDPPALCRLRAHAELALGVRVRGLDGAGAVL